MYPIFSTILAVLSVWALLPSCTPDAPPSPATSDSAPVDPDTAAEDTSLVDTGFIEPDTGVSPTACTFSDITNTPGVTLVEGPLDCAHSDADIHDCALFKAIIETPPEEQGPSDATALDDAVMPLEVIFAVRAPKQADLCATRWITFDAGGPGAGYGPFFGQVPPGDFEDAGGAYGDDLIRAYNDAGFVTVDLIWQCNTQTCPPTSSVSGWAVQNNDVTTATAVCADEPGTGWALDLAGTGFTGAASRAVSFYDWVAANNGAEPMCSHAHSAGSGRLVTALSRFGRHEQFAAVVFDGGPTANYVPWICGSDEGPLGPRPPWFGPGAMGSQLTLLNCAYSSGSNRETCDFCGCGTGDFFDQYVPDSAWMHATDLDWPNTKVGIVLGSLDDTNAWRNARLWLTGYTYGPHEIAPLTAKEITLRQGYCEEDEAQDSVTGNCNAWNADRFPGITETGRGYDARLNNVTHSTTQAAGGMSVALEVMLDKCPPL